MVYCTHCAEDCPYVKDPDKGYICCGTCGKVLDQEIYTDEPNFVKDPSGQSRLAGNILSSIESGSSLSHERTLMKGRDEIWQIVTSLHVGGGDTIIDMAHKFYTLAVDHNFTRGRRTSQVAAACLYIACRQSKKAYLLIDFSDYLKISVYVLGAVFLQLCQVLLLSEHPIVQKLIDPSLFIHRFTERLLGKRDNAVSDTALRIVASMKRDWMQTGRKPSGLCGAALYIAALSHGYNYTKSNIVAVVHVCEATLTKRLIEFENTDSGSLTIEDFLAKADEEPVPKFSPISGEVLCKHKDKEAEHFAHGLCEKCYNKFTKLSGGLEGGADPPAFQRAEKQRLEAVKKAEEAAAMKEATLGESVCEIHNSDVEHNIISPTKDSAGDKSSRISPEEIAKDYVDSKDPEVGGENGKADADPESFSDIDDLEVDGYLHNEEETQYKKIIWEEMNKEYLEEQAAKEALAAELAARGVGVGEQKKRRRNEDAKNSTPAETPAEATYNMLKRKGLGSKINVEAVGGLYNTKDEGSEAYEKRDMGFDEEYAHDIGDGETFEGAYDYADYNKDGYGDGGGAEAYDEYDELNF